jgi:hypothetical protein
MAVPYSTSEILKLQPTISQKDVPPLSYSASDMQQYIDRNQTSNNKLHDASSRRLSTATLPARKFSLNEFEYQKDTRALVKPKNVSILSNRFRDVVNSD